MRATVGSGARPPLRIAGLALTALVVAGCSLPALPAAPDPTPSADVTPPLSSGEPTTSPAASPTRPVTAPSSPSPASGRPAPSGTARPGPALRAVATLAVKGRAPLTGYERELFGPAWKDVDRNGCDTRNDVLRRDLRRVVLKPGTDGCVVRSGVLLDPYTRVTIHFVRGPGTSTAVQIDHVVALADAWQKGAFRWTEATRTRFANDPLNLLAVDGPTNQRKGAGDAATWLPPAKSYRCAYVARQIAVKRKYGVWVTRAERDAFLRVLRGCPAQRLPAG